MPWAHPRSRGENVDGREDDLPAEGSSPLTRGKHGLLVHAGHVRGLIPAHAGKTRSMRRRRSWLWAHPRSRGENLQPRDCLTVHMGSSPLTRGKRLGGPRTYRRLGLIPAHAGKTLEWLCPDKAARAHPRSRGENYQRFHIRRDRLGSSPLTRGKPDCCRRSRYWGRLIPAHAGKTRGRSSQRQSTRAHPRSRGENYSSRRPPPSGSGSSPLTRGKRRGSRRLHKCAGLIPAHAGKTPPPS